MGVHTEHQGGPEGSAAGPWRSVAMGVAGAVAFAAVMLLGSGSLSSGVRARVAGKVEVAATTRIDVSPPTLTGPMDTATPIRITIHRDHQPLVDATVSVEGTVCGLPVSVASGSSLTRVCDVPHRTLERGLAGPAELHVRVAAADDGTDVTTRVPIDLSPPRCVQLPPEPGLAARVRVDDLPALWGAAADQPASAWCEEWDEPWIVAADAWEFGDDGSVVQPFGGSTLRLVASDLGDVVAVTVTVSPDDAADLPHIRAALAAVFTAGTHEMDAVLDSGLNRGCVDGAQYAFSQYAFTQAGPHDQTILNVTACEPPSIGH